MDFPSYVPDGARRFAERFLQGSPELGSEGYEALLSEYQRELTEIDSQIRVLSRWRADQTEIPQSDHDELTDLRQRRKDKADFARRLELDVAVIRRLIYDARMKDVYRVLLNTFFGEVDTDRKIDQFLHAAWAARIDYAKYRDRLKQAREEIAEIAKTAEKLADLLRGIGETGADLPPEFYGVDYLLRETDNDKDLHIWRTTRHTILGDRRSRPDEPQKAHDPEGSVTFTICFPTPGEQPEIDPDEEIGNTIRYIWGLAPPVSALLDTLADAALRYEPAEGGFIGAAVGKRQKNIKTEYLRGFAHLLRDEHAFDLTPPIMRAMAKTANVVFDDPEVVDTTYDDVRKVVGAR